MTITNEQRRAIFGSELAEAAAVKEILRPILARDGSMFRINLHAAPPYFGYRVLDLLTRLGA